MIISSKNYIAFGTEVGEIILNEINVNNNDSNNEIIVLQYDYLNVMDIDISTDEKILISGFEEG